MLSLLPIVLALASADPSPAPSASAKPTTLTEIGRVRALPICTPIVVHANSAITTTLENDRSLSIITLNLKNTDFERLNELQRRNAIEALMNVASTVRLQSKSADGEIKRLREYAAASPDPARKAELKAFADAIGGAINRQKKVAAQMMRDVTIIQGRTEAAEMRAIEDRVNPANENRAVAALNAQRTLFPGAPAHVNEVMRQIGKDLEENNQAILTDEGVAADHSIAATAGC